MKSIIEQASSIMKAIEKAWNQAEQPNEFSIKIFEKEERNFFGMTSKPAKIGIFFGDKPIIHEKQPQKPRPEIKECRPSSFAPTSPSSFAKASADKKGYEGHGKTTADKEEGSQKVAQQKSHPAPRPHAPQQEPRQQQVRSTPQPKPVQPRPAKPSSFAKASADTAPTSPRPSHKASEGTAQSADTAPVEKPRRIPAAWNDAMISTAQNWLNKTLDLMNMKSIEFKSEVVGKNLKLTFNVPLVTDAMHEKQLFRSFAHLIMSSLRNQYKQEIKDLKVILIRPE